MTRGQITVILNDGVIWTSTEFNGDMYYENGHGEEIMETFPKVTTLDEYKEYVEWFNKTHHNYDEDVLTYELTDMSEVTDERYIFTYEEFLDMREDYFQKWFEDYLYIKNLSSETVQFIDSNGNIYDLAPMAIAVFNFGEYTDEVPDNGLKLNEEAMVKSLNDIVNMLEEKLDHLDWNFDLSEYANGYYIYISQFSPAGEDFSFEVKADSLDDIIDGICEYANDFDADEHAEMWIEARGRVNGVPSSIRELIDDADAIQDMLDELAEEVSKLR